jgi:hypothetical protein
MTSVAIAIAACGSSVTVPGIAGAVPRCDDVPRLEAAPELYRDQPIYVANEMPVEELRAWATGKPGFEEIWIDREHLGWVTLAFSRDADTRQAELKEAFPGVGVVAVAVPWTMAELEGLQVEVMTKGRPTVTSSAIRTTHGVVSIGVGVLEPARIAEIEAKFGGRRVCIEGIEPANAPVQGPQQPSGDGWRMLADVDEVGGPYRTGIAADRQAFIALWGHIGLPGAPPEVDFETEVAVWFGAVHGSSCPRLRLDDVVVDQKQAILHPVITYLDVGICTADAIGHAYVVAVDRSRLPSGPFTIQLQHDEPPPGAVEEKTIVDADLSAPGSTVTPDQLHSAPPVVEEIRVEPGGFLEPGYENRFRFDVRCGTEWLGELNNIWWRADDAPPGQAVPDPWRKLVDGKRSVDVALMLTLEPEPVLDASAGGHTITYRPSAQAAPTCG